MGEVKAELGNLSLSCPAPLNGELMPSRTLYVDGEYLAKNPAWHVEESPWKAARFFACFRRMEFPLRPSATWAAASEKCSISFKKI